MRRLPAVLLAVAVGYVLLHVLAALLGMTPDVFFPLLLRGVGFVIGATIGLAAVLSLALQITRR